MLNWDAYRFLPTESKDCMIAASYQYRNEGNVFIFPIFDNLCEHLIDLELYSR